jgi:hypothetical protein
MQYIIDTFEYYFCELIDLRIYTKIREDFSYRKSLEKENLPQKILCSIRTAKPKKMSSDKNKYIELES